MTERKWYSKGAYLAATLALVMCLGIVALPVTGTVQADPGGILNGSFETGDLSNWTIDGLGGHVETLQSSNFVPGITPPEGTHFALLSTGDWKINPTAGPDLDGNGESDYDTATLSQTFTLSASEVPTTLSFEWSFLTYEVTVRVDDFFMVTLDGVDILHGSVPGAPDRVSPFPDVPALDEQAYNVTSPGLTDGSFFGDGRTAFQDFSYVIDAPDTYTLEFLVADQWDNEVDSGLLVDNIELTPPPPVGGEAYPVNKVSIVLPWIALGMAVIAGSFVVLRRRSNKA